MIATSLPESARNIVGNGSTEPPNLMKLPFKTFMSHWDASQGRGRVKMEIPNPLKSLTLLLRRDNILVVVGISLLYSVYSCIHTSLSSEFIKVYQLNEWQAGLVYLPFGLGSTFATLLSGSLIDRSYRKSASSLGLPIQRAVGRDLDTFPIETARLRCLWIPIALAICSVVAFGWTLRNNIVRPHAVSRC